MTTADITTAQKRIDELQQARRGTTAALEDAQRFVDTMGGAGLGESPDWPAIEQAGREARQHAHTLALLEEQLRDAHTALRVAQARDEAERHAAAHDRYAGELAALAHQAQGFIEALEATHASYGRYRIALGVRKGSKTPLPPPPPEAGVVVRVDALEAWIARVANDCTGG